MDLISTALSLLSFWNLTTEPDSCIPLQDCKPLSWLLDNRDNVPSSNSNISEALRNLNCGFDQSGPKVLCVDNVEGSEDDIQEYDEEDEEEEDVVDGEDFDNESTHLRHGVIDGLSEDGSICAGSLVCYVLNDDGFSVSKVVRRKRSIEGSVFRIEIVGNCCWEAYERKRFRGSVESYSPGFDKYPGIIVKSIQKVDCRT